MKKISMRLWGIIFTAITAAVIGAVFVSQYVLHMPPCHLCLIQRVPFYVALVFGVLLIVFANHPKTARVLLGLLALTFIISMGLGIFHFGVEQKWWTYDSNCTGGNAFKPGASVQEMMAALKAAPVVKCDAAIPFLFGMSMAFYNALSSAGFALVALFASRNARRG